MRSARILLTTAAASAVLALGAPGAYAAGDDWDSSGSSYSKENRDPKYDPETYKDKEHGQDSGSKQDGGGWSGSHEKPHGGMHTGGGGLASPAMTAGGLAVLAVAGTGLYATRRKKVAGSMA
ncbi:hypothetical protein [Streptomyces sp. SAI-127]|uniref:hypothetical protein n=1 Tax=Streptomyces sp. SAI-127 TaxID=2940543 RepID=UPI002473759F|nr:hypothetical protein [Streptomyces sp. SAI-127]MDH6488599.1 hypothetical protein [Streptomyces sp. SAI-127]